ncbi:hypothetical protein N7461_002878 [Penicillium sp. DV-2018c]|nr:hypothetical protein N7461_002878 [Penicillium sp. DV-2018c]
MTEPNTADNLPNLPTEVIRLAHALAAYWQAHDPSTEPSPGLTSFERSVITFIAQYYPESDATGVPTEPHNAPEYYPISRADERRQVGMAIAKEFETAVPETVPSAKPRPKKSLLDLPVELIWLIERQLPDKAVHNLCRTNQYLYHVLIDSLCRRGMKNLRAFRWSLARNKKQAFVKAVETLAPLPRQPLWNLYALHTIINNRNVKLVGLMVSKGGWLQQQLEQLIEVILWKSRSCVEDLNRANKWESIKNCLKWGLDPNYVFIDGLSLMASAIIKSIENPYKQYREVKMLLAHGADTGCLVSLPDKDSMLHLACLYYQPKIAHALLEAGADPNLRDARNRTPIHRLFERSELKSSDRDNLLDILLADPNIRLDERDGNGRTPLHLAASHGINLPMAMKFVKRVVHLPDKVDINAQDGEGNTPLCHAISIGECYMVRLFLAQHRLDPNLGPADAFPLLLAVDFDKQPILELLLDSNRLDVNKQGSQGETALLRAIHIGNREAVKLLASAGADPDIESSEGVTARQEALDAGIRVRWKARPN